ncbi:hypothetical protein DFH09DRAFT_1089985 [Mycena vulgaris]|nr:hypothetical protein DFH09DRAFT_1089985 [Mycena vulgaris]
MSDGQIDAAMDTSRVLSLRALDIVQSRTWEVHSIEIMRFDKDPLPAAGSNIFEQYCGKFQYHARSTQGEEEETRVLRADGPGQPLAERSVVDYRREAGRGEDSFGMTYASRNGSAMKLEEVILRSGRSRPPRSYKM